MSNRSKTKKPIYKRKFKLVRTKFTAYEVKIHGKAYVGVTGRDVQMAVKDLFYVYHNGYYLPKYSDIRFGMATSQLLKEFGFRGLYDRFVTVIGTFDSPQAAQVAAIRRQNELSHTYDMVSKAPGRCIGSRQLLPDETLKTLEDELNQMEKTLPRYLAAHRFIEKHTPLHGYRITTRSVRTSES